MLTHRKIVLCLLGTALVLGTGPAALAAGEPGKSLVNLSNRYWKEGLISSPLNATILGVHDYDDRLEDISPEGRTRQRAQAAGLLKQAGTIDAGLLSGSDAVTLAMLKTGLDNRLSVQEACRPDLWNVDHLFGFQLRFARLPVYQPVTNRAQADALLKRYRSIGRYIDTDIANLKTGIKQGYKAPRVAVERVIPQVQALIATPVADSPFLKIDFPKQWTEAQKASYKRQFTQVVTGTVYPAFSRYATFLKEYLPQARTVVGVSANTNGSECYRASIRATTSKDLAPEQIHQLGLSEMERIHAEMRVLTRKLFATDDLKASLTRLREEPQYAFETAAQVEEFAVAAVKRAEAKLPEAFNILPKAPVRVEPIPSQIAKDSTAAYYEAPSIDGKRPGIYFVNTYEPRSRPRYTAEVLAYHEAVPGHHLQIAIASELKGIPEFRKHSGTTAYIEGWALYTERLADEMGLYSDDLSQMGKLSFDAWRAARLVVDSGMHALGWDRQKALDYLYENTALSKLDAENEIDRYIIWPGQALAYKVGQLEILRLREQAKERLGSRFDLRQFHDVVLKNGAVTLPVLEAQVNAWVSRMGAQAER
ncbi:MAG: DUF885 domain-containing protein [Gemmatimonadaceae bacterium]|nr:DUF885 domain-containing protein [Gloeobacterales cyanobacterium ES-bin-141]